MAPRVSAEVLERRRQVLERRAAGMTWQQIADELAPTVRGTYKSRHAFTDGQRALEAVQAELADMAKLHLALELERLDSYRRTAEQALAEARAEGDHALTLRGIDRLIKLGERQDKLLGLSRVTVEAVRTTESGGERPHAEDSTDEFSRRRAARRLAARR